MAFNAVLSSIAFIRPRRFTMDSEHQRGNNRTACFFAAYDYALYLNHLTELAQRFGCCAHAYVLMTNHVHLLLSLSGCGQRFAADETPRLGVRAVCQPPTRGIDFGDVWPMPQR